MAAGDSIGLGAGVDNVYYLDLANWKVTSDVVIYGELALGVVAGGGAGLIIGFRCSPHGKYGDPSEPFAGKALNASIKALAGVGFSISTSLLQLQEGWATICYSLGEEFGAKVSVSYAVSAQQVATRLTEMIQHTTEALSSTIGQLGLVASGISEGVKATFGGVADVFLPSRWDRVAIPAGSRGDAKFGTYMHQVIVKQGGIEAFLQTETQGLSITQRMIVDGTYEVGSFIAASNALNRRYRILKGFDPNDSEVRIWDTDDLIYKPILSFSV